MVVKIQHVICVIRGIRFCVVSSDGGYRDDVIVLRIVPSLKQDTDRDLMSSDDLTFDRAGRPLSKGKLSPPIVRSTGMPAHWHMDGAR